jgi:ArsR family transcriptional regulator
MPMAPHEAQVIRVSKALGDPMRFDILRALAERAALSCQDLTARFPISQATVSHHLKVLADAGLVSVQKRGAFHYYRAVPEALAEHAARLVAAVSGPRAPARRRRRAP